MVEAVETQEQLFTEADVSHMHEQVRALAQQWFADKKDEVDSEDSEDEEDELESWLGKLDSELQEISDLQERGNHLQRALKKLQEEVEDLRARNVEPPAEQVEALTLLRGASEVLRERWPEDKPPNEWKGVTFKEGQVSEISLVGCDELESLPPEVGGLLALTSLTLCMCKAVTELPAEVGGLRALTSLNLYGAGLTTLPAEVGGLRALTSLDLCRTDLTTLPAEVGGLRALTSLDLSHTDLTTLPAEVGGLRALTSLDLSWSGLTTLPAEVGGMIALTSLDLSGTALTTLPAVVGGLHALNSLNLGSTGLTTLPAEVGGMLALTSLNLSNNLRFMTLPAEVGGLRALASLNLQRTGLTTLPAEVGGLRALTSVNLAGTGLTTLPAEVGGLRALTSLDLSETGLTTLPAEVGGLRALTSLDLGGTGLTTLPAEVGGLRALASLNLQRTRLTTLSAEVGGLRALTSLDLRGTALTTLPAEMGGLRTLTKLELTGCDALTSPPKERHLDVVAAKDWLHGQHLVAQHSAKQWDGDEILRRLRDRPGVLHALAEQPAAVDLLRTVLEADPTLANVTEGEKLGRMPIQHACPECGVAMRAALCLLGRFEIDDGPPLHFSATSAVVQVDDLGSTDKTSGADAKPPRCALKAMRKAEQVLAELNGRDGLDPKYVVAVLAVYVDESANKDELQQIVDAAERLGVPVESAPNLERRFSLELAQRVENVEKVNGSGVGVALQRRPSSKQVLTTPETAAQEPQAARVAGYRFVLVLELANRNLNTALTHDHVAGNDFAQIRMIMSHLAKALDNLHSNQRIHADFKPLNAARELTWKLIDMDVSRKFGESFDTKLPSSGYCPPEMAKVLLALRNAKTEEAKTQELAKYTASIAYDLWSFGVVLFNLCYGISLFNTDQNDNVKLDDLQTLAEAPEGPWRKLINKALSPGERRNASIDLKAAAALLRKVLEPDPSKRLQYFERFNTPMESVLEEPFFQVGGGGALSKETQEQLDRIEEQAAAAAKNTFTLIAMGEAHRRELRRTREVLLKAIFEATDVQTPTAFIILEKKLSDDDEEEEKQMLKLKLKEDGTGFEASGKLQAKLADKVKGRFDTGMKWVERIKTFSEGVVVAADPMNIFDAMKATFKELVTAETMYLYLIDELTGKPVKGGIYPIEITTPSEIVPKLLPVMQVCVRAMSLYNGAAGIARMCGSLVPYMPTGWRKGAQESIALLKQKSSVEKFGVLHEEVMSSEEAAEREAKTVRGASLRELHCFLTEKDTDKTFAGMRRLGNNDGTAVWTLLTDKEVLAAIEARAKERLAEQAAQEKFYCELLVKLEREEPTREPSSLLPAVGQPPVNTPTEIDEQAAQATQAVQAVQAAQAGQAVHAVHAAQAAAAELKARAEAAEAEAQTAKKVAAKAVARAEQRQRRQVRRAAASA